MADPVPQSDPSLYVPQTQDPALTAIIQSLIRPRTRLCLGLNRSTTKPRPRIRSMSRRRRIPPSSAMGVVTRRAPSRSLRCRQPPLDPGQTGIDVCPRAHSAKEGDDARSGGDPDETGEHQHSHRRRNQSRRRPVAAEPAARHARQRDRPDRQQPAPRGRVDQEAERAKRPGRGHVEGEPAELFRCR